MSDITPAIMVSIIAAVIAEQLPNSNQLNLVASILNQLGDTLATIAATRELNDQKD